MRLGTYSFSTVWFLLLIIVVLSCLDPVHSVPFKSSNGTAAVPSSSSNGLVEEITDFALDKIAMSVAGFSTLNVIAQPLPLGPGGMTEQDFQHITLIAYEPNSHSCLITMNTFQAIYVFSAPFSIPHTHASGYAPFDWYEQHAATGGHAVSVGVALQRLREAGHVGPWLGANLCWPDRDPVDGGNGREMWIMLHKLVRGRKYWCLFGSSTGRMLCRSRGPIDGVYDELGGVDKLLANLNGTVTNAEAS